MATFIMLGKYSSNALKKISAQRTKSGLALIKKSGGKVETMLALLGEYDLVIIASFPGISKAMEASIALGKLTEISFKTLPAIPVEEFDKLGKK